MMFLGGKNPVKSLFGGVLLIAAHIAVTNAQQTAPTGEAAQPAFGEQVEQIEDQVGENRAQLREILRERGLADARIVELSAEIDQIKKDRASITAALIAAAKAEQKLAGEVLQLQDQITQLGSQVADITASLWERRELLAEVLAALQRMGLNPPPAILVQPEDALASVRSSILLASVVPEMRQQASILQSDLRRLASLRATAVEENTRLSETREEQAAEQARLELLVLEKRRLEADRQKTLDERRARSEQLAARAETLENLIQNLQNEADQLKEEAKRYQRELKARLEREEAERLAALRREEADRQATIAENERRQREAQAALEKARQRAADLAAAPQIMTPSQPFSTLKDNLPKPVVGITITAYGAEDGLGNLAQGDTIETLPNTIVTAPADGTVLYAGPFRAYGNLLILDAGENYHIVLAGMDRIDVSQGQFVVAGEPVGIMGSVRLASVSAAAATGDKPTLYVELRKDSKPVDTGLWWSS
ncbi:MAG: peptidoglycan DD-metalloendopeptidase family protein [Pseudomonadota bacterium]